MKPALFLDRDGVINKDKEYLYKIKDLEFIADIFDFCSYFYEKGYYIFIVTNQSGIARGYYSEDDFNLLMDYICNEFKEHSIDITKVYHCPHHPDVTGECDCRKPKSGMIRDACSDYDVDIKNSLLVGDSVRDIEAGYNYGITNLYLLCGSDNVKANYKEVSSLKDILKDNLF